MTPQCHSRLRYHLEYPDNATVQSVVDDPAMPDRFISPPPGREVRTGNPEVKNLNGQNGTISLRVRRIWHRTILTDWSLTAAGQPEKTILNLVNAGDSASGLATSGKGIQVVEAINGATTEEGAFVRGTGCRPVPLTTPSTGTVMRAGICAVKMLIVQKPLYASMLTQAMDYDRIVAGSRSHQTGVNGENNSVRLSIQGGHLGHDNDGGIARRGHAESSGSYGIRPSGG